MSSPTNSVPYGVQILQKISDKCPRLSRIIDRENLYKYSVLVLTFITYAAYHASRKPISVVKIVLYQNCSEVTTPAPINNTDPDWCNWAPFNAENHSALFGTLDSAFLFAYAIAMFFSGLIAERVNIRIFLTIGMILSGTACSMFGLAHFYNIHSMWYFIGVQIFGGICQTTGWPGVVTAMGNWFGKGNRGFIFGIWNSHTSIGNIIGTLLASLYVESNWGLSFIVPGIFIITSGILNYLFLVVHPTDINTDTHLNEKVQNGHKALERNGIRRQSSHHDYNIPEENEILKGSSEEKKPSTSPQEVSIPLGDISSKELSLLPSNKDEVKEKTEGSPILSHLNGSPKKAVGFIGAIKIPGVVEFSMCLFFAKLVSYTFLYWLPNYIKNSSTYSPSQSADLSTLFDVGGIFGGIAAGIFSDMFGKSACTCAVMLFLAIPSLYIYNLLSSVSLIVNIALLVIAGGLVNGPYALITTAVSAELGTHSSLKGNAKALSTVTSIIDGTGSIGAAVGPLLAAYISDHFGWTSVFYMLMSSNVLAILLLTRLVKRELQNVG
ncbi:glucose-6-phosphate exchanger SLC37A2 isoform X1 [Melanaphis sacchari]|uniref:Sugar phosphate exchanger 3 n=2 Tax=Melanaphis sacchari TaxID=742174 RepID=A0A2H8TRE2_9HEMI|nr:glucose-6-phosphate exchanger SLC37A2 isoform X1 [Melanaphis sacchari]XP_025191688.1 glucose-6-phosphate exchanger SLC37A2 isoform X1 [Melanaphis sacchari]